MSVGQSIFEKNKIYHGDCLEMMKQIPDKSINLVVVDLPYNIGKAYKSDLEWDKWETIDKYIEWVGKGFKQVERILKDNGSFYWFHNDFETLCEIQQFIKKNTKFKYRQFITWNKRFDGGKKKSYLDGYVMEERTKNYYKMCEYIMFYTFENHWKVKEEREKRGLKQTDISKEIKSKNGNFTGWFSNIESGKYFPTEQTIIPIKKHLELDLNDLVHTFNNQKKHHSVWNYEITEKTIHPTQKPLDLIKNIILHSSNEGDVVLDYTAGYSTTAIACIETKRDWIMIEKDSEFYNHSLKRVEDFLNSSSHESSIEAQK